MMEIINDIFSSRILLVIGAWYGLPITIGLIVLYFVKSSRDERGQAIIGKASIISMIVFMVLVNAFAKIADSITINYLTTACSIQWIYNIVLTVNVVAIIIYKKIQ